MKVIYKILFFIILFFFLNIKSPKTNELLKVNYYENELKEDFFTIKLTDFNIYNLTLFKNSGVQIISIYPKENKYNIEKLYVTDKNINKIIETSISNYRKKINDMNEDSIYINSKGFIVSKIKIYSSYKDLFKLDKKIKFDILNT